MIKGDSDSIWGSKDFQVPEYFNFADVLDEWAQKEKDGEKKSENPALWWVDGDGQEVKWNFQELALNSKRAANVLCTVANIKPGEKVMVLLHRIPEYWLMQLACLRTGAVLVPVAVDLGPAELQRRISVCKPSCFVAGGGVIENDLLDCIDQFCSSPHARVKCRLMVNRMKETSRNSGLRLGFSTVMSIVGWQSFEDFFGQVSSEHQAVRSLSSAPITIVFTSGTTGNSKIVEHSQGSWGLRNRIGMEKQGGLAIVQSDLVWSHSSTGWSVSLILALASWSVGAGIFVHYRNIKAKEALEILQHFPVTFAFFLPRCYINAVEEDLKSFQFPKLSACYTVGEPMNKNAMRKWKEGTGVDLREVYGQTEAGALCCTSRNEENRIGSVGRANPGVDLAIIDENNQEVSPGKIGRIAIRVKPYRPVGMFTRYVDDPVKTAARFSGDFYITGDLGLIDEDGYIWIAGRTDDVIFVNGENIYPGEVEDCLVSHYAVLKCAVVSSPDPLRQACVKAFVVLSSDFKNKEQDEMKKELQDFVTKSTAAWMRPAKMEFVDVLPTTPETGKINRKELKQKEWNQIAE